jgi:hypothetical protein
MGRRGDALRLVRADTAALRKFIRAYPDIEAPQETCTGTVRQPAGEDAGPTGKGFWLHSVMGRRGDALRLVRADTAALRKFIRV